MAKGNGGTRGESPATKYGPAFRVVAPSYQNMVNSLSEGNYPYGWDDLDTDHRELALMESGFNGLANEDAMDLMFEEKNRDNILGQLADNIVSEAMGYGHDYDVTATIHYKDGTSKSYEDGDFDIGFGGNRGSRAMYNQALRTMDRRNIAFVTYQDGASARYWANGTEGMNALKRYTGYEKWTNGRGEKRRDYVQDDWI